MAKGDNCYHLYSLGTPWATSVSLYYGVSEESWVVMIAVILSKRNYSAFFENFLSDLLKSPEVFWVIYKDNKGGNFIVHTDTVAVRVKCITAFTCTYDVTIRYGTGCFIKVSSVTRGCLRRVARGISFDKKSVKM